MPAASVAIGSKPLKRLRDVAAQPKSRACRVWIDRQSSRLSRVSSCIRLAKSLIAGLATAARGRAEEQVRSALHAACGVACDLLRTLRPAGDCAPTLERLGLQPSGLVGLGLLLHGEGARRHVQDVEVVVRPQKLLRILKG